MRSRRSPSFPSGLAKKKKRNPERGGVRRAAAAAASRRRFPRRPRLPFPEAGGCARARGPPATQAERAARRGDNTAGSPGTGSSSARGLGPAGRGRGRVAGGPLGKRGARASGPPGERPLLAGDPARRPGSASERLERRRSGTLLFCRPRIVGSSGQPGHICRRRRRHCRAGLGPPKSQRGGGPGRAGRRARAGAELAGHFLCPAALPPAPLPPRPRPPRTLPARPPPPPASPALAALFGWGEPKRKSFAGGAGEGAPRAAGTRRGAATAGRPRSPLPPCPPRRRTDPRGRGEAPFFLCLALFPAPRGKLDLGARDPGRAGALHQPERPAAWPVARCPRNARVLGGRGPGSSARSPPAASRHTRAHAPSGGFAFRRRRWSRTPSVSARASVCSAPSPRNTFSGGGPSSCWLQGSPCLVFNK